jgi:DNA helicase TIP49 (TBP-interacting protein)
VRIRATTEGLQITDAAIDKIAEHGVRISLRYCLQLLTPSRYVRLISFPGPRLPSDFLPFYL